MVAVKPQRRGLDARMCVFLTGEKPLCSSKTCEVNGVVDTDTCECKCEGDYYGSSCESKCDLLCLMALLLYHYVQYGYMFTVAECIMHLYCRMYRTSIASASACCVVCECSVTAKPEHLFTQSEYVCENDELYIYTLHYK